VTQHKPALVTPFWVRIATETSLSPGWLLIAFPAVLYPSYLALEALFGRGLAAAMDFTGDWEAAGVPAMTTSLGYLVMMYVYATRGTIRDLDALGPVLRGGEGAIAELRRQLTQFGRRGLWIGGLAGFAVVCVTGELTVERWSRLLAGEFSLRDAYLAVISIPTWIVIGRGTVFLIDLARLYSRIGEQHVAVDLLDLGPLTPLTRHGLRIVLFIVILMAVFSPFGSDPRGAALLLAALFWNLTLLLPVFLLPLRGLRRQIRQRKAEELSRTRGEINRARETAASLGAGSAEAAGLQGLLAFEKRIESVREWPFDAPTLTRFFLYVAIPLGSWVGGALVERLLGAALD